MFVYYTYKYPSLLKKECKSLIDCVILGNLTILSVFLIFLQGICTVILKKK